MAVRLGDRKLTKSSGECVVTKVISGQEIEVTFEDGYVKKCRPEAFLRGSIKNPMYPSVFGVGFLGVGPYKSSINKVQTKEGALWRALLQRCYDEVFKQRHPTYAKCSVFEGWLNFQVFSEWCNSQIGFDKEGWNLDKDILLKGNKIYSPETCVFVPTSINNLVINNKSSRGDYPVGVSFHNKKQKFSASCHVSGKGQKHLGYYETPEEAFAEYKRYKKLQINEVAEKYKDVVDCRVYTALLNWEISSND